MITGIYFTISAQRVFTHTRSHAHARTRARAHAHTHAHTHKHTHAQTQRGGESSYSTDLNSTECELILTPKPRLIIYNLLSTITHNIVKYGPFHVHIRSVSKGICDTPGEHSYG